ncbi:MAG: tetratricopeptide repeat protein, partial [Spirochaetes bacterium]|nr:tetratricopeptide repeat protein [Spirochaetota bacterium]
MKKYLLALLIITFSTGVQSKDFNKTEEMIETILSEESGSAVKQQTEQVDLQQADDTTTSTENETGTEEDAASSRKNSMSGKDESIYKTAIRLYETGYYDHSLAKFNEIISSYSDSKFLDNAHIWAGRIYIKKYKYDDAIKEFDSVRDTSGEYPASLFYKAEAYRYKGDKISSIEFYQKYASEYPGDPLAAYSILNAGKLYLGNKQGTESLEAAIRLIKNYPDSDTIDDAYYLIAKIYEKDPVL